jgi:PIN domain nuclease of toxin-antitoxin system
VLWFQTLLAKPGIYLTPLAPDAAIEAAALPGRLHRDPADRLLIATARDLGVPLVTRDVRILAYAAQGHLDAIPC